MPTQNKKSAAKAKTATKPKTAVKNAQTAKTAKRAQTTAKTTKKSTAKTKPEAKEVAVQKRTIPKPRVVVGFVDFLREQSVVGLAIGLVIGSQVKALADQLINSFINPLLGLVLPGAGSLNNKIFTLHLEHKTAIFAWGAFVAVLLSFITTAAVVYVVFKSLKLDTLTKKKDSQK